MRSCRSSARNQRRWSTPSQRRSLAVRDPDAPVATDIKGKPKPDPTLRDYENVPLPSRSVSAFEADTIRRLNTVDVPLHHRRLPRSRSTRPYVPDVWHDPKKTKIGYEIPLTRHFYTYTPPRPLQQIDAEIRILEVRDSDSPRARYPDD